MYQGLCKTLGRQNQPLPSRSSEFGKEEGQVHNFAGQCGASNASTEVLVDKENSSHCEMRWQSSRQHGDTAASREEVRCGWALRTSGSLPGSGLDKKAPSWPSHGAQAGSVKTGNRAAGWGTVRNSSLLELKGLGRPRRELCSEREAGQVLRVQCDLLRNVDFALALHHAHGRGAGYMVHQSPAGAGCCSLLSGA